MTLAIRFYSPVAKTLYTNGRSYKVTAGGTVDVPYSDGLAIQSDQARALMITGATSDRPGNDASRANWPPAVMYDTTLAKVIFLVPGSNPASWVDLRARASQGTVAS
jgi:hypothetical protein